jgi:hypothetical protein
VNAVGSHQTGNGSGNGSSRKTNVVKQSQLYRQCCDQIEAKHPRVREEQLFPSMAAWMVICDVPAHARQVSGFTWVMTTPDDFSPPITFYFTYASGTVMMQAAWADD